MKKTLILATILMLTACSKVGIEPIMKHQISENRQITQVITKKSQLKSNKLKKQILGSYSLDGRNSKDIWTKLNTDIDFTKDNILIYTVYQVGNCGYDEKFIKKDSQQVDIVLSTPKKSDTICTYSELNHYLIYKVSKKIKKVGIKAFRHDYVIVEMK